MATTQETALLHRDGTGQNDRFAPALRPEHFQADEHSLADWLRFARQLGQQLRYFDFAGRETGDWSAFAGADDAPVAVEEIAAFFNDPEAFFKTADANKARWLSRPHFALFLAFLDLLRLQQVEINRFTGRHLVFYYRQILGIQPKAPEADRVFVLLELARGAAQHRVEVGTRLLAGKNPEGQPRYFVTDEEMVVNRARVAEMRVFFQERTVEGLAERYHYHLKNRPLDFSGAINAMLRLAYPEKNAPLDELRASGLLPAAGEPQLNLSLADFRRLMLLKKKRVDGSREDTSDWQTIHRILKSDGDKRNFQSNFQYSLQFYPFPEQLTPPQPPGVFYARLQSTVNAEELHELILDLRKTPDSAILKTILQHLDEQRSKGLFVLEHGQGVLETFEILLETFLRIREDWKRINRLLMKAGQKSPEGFPWAGWTTLPHVPSFADRVAGTLTSPAFTVAQLDDRWSRLRQAEQNFNLPAENLKFILEQATANPSEADLDQLVRLLERAYAARDIIGLEQKFRLKNLLGTPAAEVNAHKLVEHIFGKNGSRLPDYGSMLRPLATDRMPRLTIVKDMLARLETDLDTRAAAPFARLYLRDNFAMDGSEFRRMTELLAFFDPGSQSPAVAEDVDALYALLAEARLRQILTPKKPRDVRRTQIWAAPDATLLRTDRAGESHPRWATFGRSPFLPEEAEKPPALAAELGLVIQSPLLALAAGTRTVTLRFFGETAFPAGLAGKFRFQLSSPDEKTGFIEIEQTIQTAGAELACKLELPADPKPVAAPGEDFFQSDDSHAPLLKMIWADDPDEYEQFANLKISRTTLQVEVKNALPEKIWSDEREGDPKKPFEPFGLHPRAGSRFAVAHSEWNGKPLESVTLHWEWMGKPDFASHYSGYDPSWVQPKMSIFAKNTSGAESEVEKDKVLPNGDYAITGSFGQAEQLVLELTGGDFGHDQYLRNIASKGGNVEITNRTRGVSTNEEHYQNVAIPDRPNPPYTPKIKTLTLSYTTQEVDIWPPSPKLETSNPKRLRHLLPFGHARPEPTGNNTFRLLPALPNEAELCIGLENADPLQYLNLLFQVAEGSADPDLERRPLHWQYLAAEGWQPAPNETDGHLFLLSDGTDGLTRSGIVRLALPEKICTDNPEMPRGKFWLRVSIPENRRSACDLIGVHTQAVVAARVLSPLTGSPAPLSEDDPGLPLPPETIPALAVRSSAIKRVFQPYGSFGGRSSEQEVDWYRRSAERLRHKQRALTIWDVERLVLERFPDVFKVKCLPAGALTGAAMEPGEVFVIVVPDLRGRMPMDPFEPRLPMARLDEIAAWLRSIGPEAARYRVRNARYLPLTISVTISLRPGYDPAFHKKLLNTELARLLAPWAFDAGADIPLGGSVHAGQVLNFIEERPYVDFVTRLALRWTGFDGIAYEAAQPEEQAPDVVWVSARRHDIALAEDARPEVCLGGGIGYLSLEIDFEIGAARCVA